MGQAKNLYQEGKRFISDLFGSLASKFGYIHNSELKGLDEIATGYNLQAREAAYARSDTARWRNEASISQAEAEAAYMAAGEAVAERNALASQLGLTQGVVQQLKIQVFSAKRLLVEGLREMASKGIAVAVANGSADVYISPFSSKKLIGCKLKGKNLINDLGLNLSLEDFQPVQIGGKRYMAKPRKVGLRMDDCNYLVTIVKPDLVGYARTYGGVIEKAVAKRIYGLREQARKLENLLFGRLKQGLDQKALPLPARE